MKSLNTHCRPQRRGAMLVLLSIAMIIFMVFAAMAIEVSRIQLARTELRTSTDAAAKAAAEALARTQDLDSAIRRGQEIAAVNRVNGQPVLLRADDFQFGRSIEDPQTGKFTFNDQTRPINSIRVRGARDQQSASGAIPLLFAKTLGREAFEIRQQATATYLERDIVLIIDRSGSMRGEPFRGLREAIDLFAQILRHSPVKQRVGLASYSTDATVDLLLTEDTSELIAAMEPLQAAGWTSISAGMSAGQRILAQSRNRDFVERTMIVMTDGHHNRGREPREVAQPLATEGVTIHTITFTPAADVRRMREVATLGRGRHYHADDTEQLREVYHEIALTLSTILTQ